MIITSWQQQFEILHNASIVYHVPEAVVWLKPVCTTDVCWELWIFQMHLARDPGKQYLHEIVANGRNGLDVDKFDYLRRDAKCCGVRIAADIDRLRTFSKASSHPPVWWLALLDWATSLCHGKAWPLTQHKCIDYWRGDPIYRWSISRQLSLC